MLFKPTLIIILSALSVQAGPFIPRATIGDSFMHLPVNRATRSFVSVNKRDDGTIETRLTNHVELYTVEVEIGTPPQKTFVSVDTGSNELWVNPNCSSVLEAFGERELCDKAPFVNISESSSARGPGDTETIGYGSLGEEQTGVILDLYQDTVRVGDATIESQRLGIPSRARGLAAGLMGLAPPRQGWAINHTYPFLVDNLFLQNITNSRAYSIALGSMDNSTGSLLFGGIDTKKFRGKLVSLPIVDSVDGSARLTINYKSLMIESTNGSKEFEVNSTNVQVDSGNTFTKLKADLVQQIWDVVGAKLDEDLGYPVVDCSTRQLPGGVVFGFDGISVTVSFSDMIYEAEGICLFGIVKTIGEDQQILGDTFMRSAYVVVDMDNRNIHLAQYSNCGSDIKVIGSGEAAVPSATGSCGHGSKDDATPTESPVSPSGAPDGHNAGESLLVPHFIYMVAAVWSMSLFC